MYNYSPINKIYVKNFRNIGEVEIDFTQSPIVTLIGDNEAGKTSIVKAFGVCALHANPRDQKDYIRDGTKSFGVAVEFENGKRVTRIKDGTAINSYQVTDKDGNFILKLPKITDGLPSEVQDLMGLIAEPETGEFLHIRTYEDKLLFVVTPNSTNYKVMYNALKVDQLTKAIKIGSNEVNALRANISSNENSIETLSSQAKSIVIYDTEPLLNIRKGLQYNLGLMEKMEKIVSLKETVKNCENRLGAIRLIDTYKLGELNESLAVRLNNASRILKAREEKVKLLENVAELDTLEEINVNTFNKVNNLKEKIDSIREISAKADALDSVNNLSELNENKVRIINKLRELNEKRATLENSNYANLDSCSEIDINKLLRIHNVNTMVKKVKASNEELVIIDGYIEEINKFMISSGVRCETCSKCGETLVIGV